MRNKNLFINLSIVFIFFLVSFFVISYSTENISEDKIKGIKIGDEVINVELALTNEEKTQGLSGRENLEKNEGMLFIFDVPGEYYFWMKDMNFPIDIIWIGESKDIVYMKKDAKPENFLETYGSEVDAKYVLEVVSGFSDRNNLKVGERVEFVY